MNILFIGDIFASPGRRITAEKLPEIVGEERIDLVIANAENSAGGFGITPNVAQELFGMGIDVLTSGNHIWDKREIYEYLNREPRLLRPHNYPAEAPGSGVYVGKTRSGVVYAVLNLQGRVHMPATACPFRTADEILEGLSGEVRVRFVDFHAEVTSEKCAMGIYLDGRVSAVVGTHTHIPTADTRILPRGTAYQTDSGMTGPYASVIGVDPKNVIHRFKTSLPVKFETATEGVELRGVVVGVDGETGLATRVKPIARP
jgi:hypothetical protein